MKSYVVVDIYLYVMKHYAIYKLNCVFHFYEKIKF
jgi:hypothetical protein